MYQPQLRVLDLYSCQGGATYGYRLAGARVTGVDKDPQPRYCGHTFHQSDAIKFVENNMGMIRRSFDFIHASPPCQFDSDCQRIMKRDHPDLIDPTRGVLNDTGLPWIMENVRGALPKLHNPIELCGTMFGLRTYRHRYFEPGGGWSLAQPVHPAHTAPQAKMGRAPKPNEYIQAVGNFSGVSQVSADWGVQWMNRDGIREAIPPAYAHYVGKQFLTHRTKIWNGEAA